MTVEVYKGCPIKINDVINTMLQSIAQSLQALELSGIFVILSQLVTGFTKVIAFNILELPNLSVTVYGPIRSIQTVSHGVMITFLGGILPYFFFYSFGRLDKLL